MALGALEAEGAQRWVQGAAGAPPPLHPVSAAVGVEEAAASAALLLLFAEQNQRCESALAG